jgi:SnoaL-like domain
VVKCAPGDLVAELSNRVVVRAYYSAVAARDIERIASFLDDEIDWLIQGPIGVFHFFGQRHGKAAVLQSFRDMACVAQVTG